MNNNTYRFFAQQADSFRFFFGFSLAQALHIQHSSEQNSAFVIIIGESKTALYSKSLLLLSFFFLFIRFLNG